MFEFLKPIGDQSNAIPKKVESILKVIPEKETKTENEPQNNLKEEIKNEKSQKEEEHKKVEDFNEQVIQMQEKMILFQRIFQNITKISIFVVIPIANLYLKIMNPTQSMKIQ